MQIVACRDKAVAESRERVQAALHASGLALPPKRITINLAPADLPKEGSHFDLPIALGLWRLLAQFRLKYSLRLCGDRRVKPRRHACAVSGALPAAIGANALGKGLICPFDSGAEAAWAGPDLIFLRQEASLLSPITSVQPVALKARPGIRAAPTNLPDLLRSRGRRAPSALWRWPPPVGITS